MNMENTQIMPFHTGTENKPDSKHTKSPASKPAQIFGVYVRTLTRNTASGYTVFTVRTTERAVICYGNMLAPYPGLYVNVSGVWAVNKNGDKVIQKAHAEIAVHSPQSIYEFVLGVKGIGPVAAREIADRLGMSLYDLMCMPNPAQTLAGKTGVRYEQAVSVVEYTAAHRNKAILYTLLDSAPNGHSLTERLTRAYGDNALNAYLADPYIIGAQFGIPMQISDKVVSARGTLDYEDTHRIAAYAMSAMRISEASGNSCLTTRDAVMEVRRLMSNKDSAAKAAPSAIMAAASTLSHDMLLYMDGDYLYQRTAFWDEVRAAVSIRRIIRSGVKVAYDPDALCDYAEQICGVKYAEQQREAFRMFRTGGICVLTGGPGTGKTTVVKGLVAGYEKLFPDRTVVLCAPTGRAAQRMKETTGREASTIHKLLDYVPYGNSFSCKNEGDQIDADFIVVDESSMISIDMAALFFAAVRSGTTILLVGDTAQLPSVGPGNVLADIISSKTTPVFALTKTHRQGAGSLIIENAHRVNNGIDELLTGREFLREPCTEERIYDILRNVYFQYYKADDPFSIQILATTKKNTLMGCGGLNKAMQEIMHPNEHGELNYRDTKYFLGDKVMMIRNNYNIGYFNGDIGLIRSITADEVVVEINDEMVHVPASMLDDMTLAYACTIHKSQGSEYDVVIAIIPNTPVSMLQRNILYTAITRAKRRVILVAGDEAIFASVNTVNSTQRTTRLADRLSAKTSATTIFTKDRTEFDNRIREEMIDVY